MDKKLFLNTVNEDALAKFNAKIDRRAILKSCKHFVLDMDGTFYRGEEKLVGSDEFLKTLSASGRDFLFFTNNSSKSPNVYLEKLAKMNCKVSRDKLMTSGDITIEYLRKNYCDKKIFLLGTPALCKQFSDAGITLVDDEPDIVVVGFDTTLTYEKIVKASNFVRAGAIYLATHPDVNCPVEDGYITDVGAFCEMISASAGVGKVKSLGKPNAETLEMIMRKTNWQNKNEIAFVGDRLYTDIAAGVKNGSRGFLVLTGEASVDDVAKSDVKPDAIFYSLGEMAELLK